jgi:STE24 endopeptidase
MIYTTLFWIIIAILVLNFTLEKILDYLNRKNVSLQLPEEVREIYNTEEYEKQQRYFLTNLKFSTISGIFSFIVIMLMFFLFGFAFVDNIARGIAENSIFIALIFFGILYFANDILCLPFEIYHTFVIEERFGFNKMTPKIFVMDTIKGWIMAIIFGGGLIALLMVIYQSVGEYFWLIGWGVMAGISIFLMMFYSQLIVPLFNKQTPLEEGELRDAIESFCREAGFKLDNLFVIDGSKRTTKANAYFSGLGSKKRIVLYDTLISTLDTNEIVSVLAHEIGHYKKKHTRTMLFLSLINAGIMFFILSLVLKNDVYIAQTLGSIHPSFQFSIIVFGILYTPISTLLGIGINIISRNNEYEADKFAKSFGLAEPLGNALKKLSVTSLTNLNPHPAYVFFHYSHPTLLQRLRNLRN